MNGRVPTQQVEGVVQAVNTKGLKIGGAWVNVSQFTPVELPEAGAHVRLEVDSKGYIKALELLGSKPSFRESDTEMTVSRDDRIARLAVLKAAAEFVGLMSQSREEVRSEHVLPLADKWLAWVNSE
jgi:hypothetical protein